MTAHFVSPVIQENPTGWGPCAVPEKFKDIPYQPFSKGDRLGKVGQKLFVRSKSVLTAEWYSFAQWKLLCNVQRNQRLFDWFQSRARNSFLQAKGQDT